MTLDVFCIIWLLMRKGLFVCPLCAVGVDERNCAAGC